MGFVIVLHQAQGVMYKVVMWRVTANNLQLLGYILNHVMGKEKGHIHANLGKVI
jgi:hypothetical protein